MGKHNHHDVEAPAAGGSSFPPPPPAVGVAGVACTYMIERPELRWAFIRKVYVIVSVQLLVTVAVAGAVNLVEPIKTFFQARTPEVLVAYVIIIISPLISTQLLILSPSSSFLSFDYMTNAHAHITTHVISYSHPREYAS
jgi:hypothetical protein